MESRICCQNFYLDEKKIQQLPRAQGTKKLIFIFRKYYFLVSLLQNLHFSESIDQTIGEHV